jgi:dipeptidyl-peptidase-4
MRTIVLLPVLCALPLQAQAPRQFTAEDYARAERRLGATMNPLVDGAVTRVTWMEDGRVWYRVSVLGGGEFRVADPARRVRAAAFDHARVAEALGRAVDTVYDAAALPVAGITPSAVTFTLRGRTWSCDLRGDACQDRTPARPAPGPTTVVSPDGRKGAFVRDHNLWVRDLETGRETQLTTDGEEHYAYATNNAGWTRSNVPVVTWSPDSRRIATFQHDGRAVGMMYQVNTAVGAPTLEAWKYPLPGDSAIFTIRRVVIDVEQAKVVAVDLPPDMHRSTVCDHVVCGGRWADVQWYADGSHVAFVSSSRDHKEAILRIADAATGAVRTVLEERVATHFESGTNRENWRVLPGSTEVLWQSERDDLRNLYLYDLASGRLKHQITRGPGPVLELLHVDERGRALVFTAAGKEAGRDPYYRHLYRIGFDGRNLRLLTPEDANHAVNLSPDGRYFVDTWSTPTTPPTTVLRDVQGRLLLTLERGDLSRLVAGGWTPPIPFTVKARDGVTDLYGLMYLPSAFDSTRSYPVLNYLYPGPQSGSVGSRSFSAARGDKQALAELGFVVVEVDGMGTPLRSKSFHDTWYGNMGDNTLPDQVGMIRQLAARHRWMDTTRVGIWGHSGGGFAAAGGMFRYPDFYKVGVAQAGNHDNRNYEDDWGERYQGLLVRYPDGTTNYDNQANQLVAENLKGKLLLAHGTLDNNVPVSNTMLVVDALIRANKDFDLLLLPNRRHGFGNEPYMMRRRWDYFVRHLMGAEPPADYVIGRLAP